MTGPPAVETPETLGYRHVRTIVGIGGMLTGVAVFVGIQFLRAAQDKLLTAQHIPPAAIVPPVTWMQVAYNLAIPVGVPLVIFGMGVMMFSPTLAGQLLTFLRGLLPGAKPA